MPLVSSDIWFSADSRLPVDSRLPPEPVVDLGNMFDLPDEEPPRPINWATARWWRIAVPVCAVLLGTFASASAVRAPLATVATIPFSADGRVLVSGQTLFVYADDAAHTARINAYDLAHGNRIWSVATREHAAEVTLQYRDGSVIVSSNDDDPVGHTVDTESFDAATGRKLWSTPLFGATVASTGILVQSSPSLASGPPLLTFEMLDPRSGHARWSADIGVDCVIDVESDPAVNLLVSLCPNSSELSVLRLTDGVTAATRKVALGSVAAEGRLPYFDQVRQPQIGVVAGSVLIAHANAPTPTIDAYATSDLAPLWNGLPMIEGQDIEECGPSLCIYTASLVGTVLDPLSGKKIGTVAPPTYHGPATGTLLISAPREPASTRGDVPMYADGVDAQLSAGLLGDVWLQQWRTSPGGTLRAVPIQLLHGVNGNSCTLVGGYLACLVARDRLSIWQLPEAARRAEMAAAGPASFSLLQRPAPGGHFGHYGLSKQASSIE